MDRSQKRIGAGDGGRAQEGYVDRAGVRVAYQVTGDGPTTVLLLPGWSIVHSGQWRAQVAGLSDRYRVVTIDPRGNGRSDRPTDPAAHDPQLVAGDAPAVLDAIGVERAVLVGNSFGTVLAYLAAGLQPDRVQGLMLICPSSLVVDGQEGPLQAAFRRFHEPLDDDQGWARLNWHYWQRDYEGFVRWFVRTVLPEPELTAARADAVSWGLSITPEQLAATVVGRSTAPLAATAARLRALAERITCPGIVVHGERDPLTPRHRSEEVARLLGARLVELPGAGHCPQVSRPDRITALIGELVEATRAPARA